MKRLLSLFLLLSAIACGASAAEGESDCRGICNAQKNCRDGSFDAAVCAENCNARSRDDEAFEEAVEECEECIEERTCAEVGTSCDAVCPELSDAAVTVGG